MSTAAMTMAPYAGEVSSRSDLKGSLEIAALGVLIVVCFALQSFATLIGGVFLCLLFCVRHRRVFPVDGNSISRGILVSALLLPAFFKPGHGLSPVFYMFATIVAFMTAYAVTRFSAAAIHRAAQLIFWTLSGMVALILAVYWGSPEPFAEVIEGSSTNGIPAYMIIVQLFLCTTFFVINGRAPLLTPALTFFFAFIGNGRGSLVVGALLIAGSLVINLFPRNVPFLYRATFFAISLGAMAFIAINALEIFDYLSRYTKLSVGIADRNRSAILDSYLATITPYTFFMGADYSGTIIDILYEGNPHISYIRTHSFFGIFPLIIAILSPLVVLLARARFSLKIPIAFFAGLAIVRAATEPILFPTLLDVFYFAIIMIFFRAKSAGQEGRVA